MKNKVLIAVPSVGAPFLFLPPTWAAPVAAIVTVLAIRWVPRMARQNAMENATRATRELPLVLDVMALSLDAGISWDRATRLAAVGCDSVLAAELEQAAGRLSMGAAADEAWQGSAAGNLIREVVWRSGRSGSAVSEILRQQADLLRSQRRMERIARVRRLDTTILLPLTMLAIPAFIVLSAIPTGISMFATLIATLSSTGRP